METAFQPIHRQLNHYLNFRFVHAFNAAFLIQNAYNGHDSVLIWSLLYQSEGLMIESLLPLDLTTYKSAAVRSVIYSYYCLYYRD